MTPMRKYTEQELDALKTRNGGYDAKTLKMIGVPWPPPKGWRQALLKGEPIPPNLTNAGVKKSDGPRKLVPLAEYIARHEQKNGAGTFQHTCTATACTYPECKCIER